MFDTAYAHDTPRCAAFMAALYLAHGDTPAAQLQLLELLAWVSFDGARRPRRGTPVTEVAAAR